MNILVVNDDGYQSKGLEILVKALLPHGRVYVSAPCDEQSAKSHGISIGNKITIKRVPLIAGSMDTIAVCGTPADATRVGLKFFNKEFDLVVSGINNGPNIARDVLYSGTVAAALEAKLFNINAVAISADNVEVSYLYDETLIVMNDVIKNELYNIEGILNINFPKQTIDKPQGIKYTTLGLRNFHNEYIQHKEEKDIYFIKHSINQYVEAETSDVTAFDNGFVSITPLTLDRTCYNSYNKLQIKWVNVLQYK